MLESRIERATKGLTPPSGSVSAAVVNATAHFGGVPCDDREARNVLQNTS